MVGSPPAGVVTVCLVLIPNVTLIHFIRLSATHEIGFTEHSGCPVYEGEKKIVTQWIRLGVDDENPWDSLNTLGVKKGEEEG